MFAVSAPDAWELTMVAIYLLDQLIADRGSKAQASTSTCVQRARREPHPFVCPRHVNSEPHSSNVTAIPQKCSSMRIIFIHQIVRCNSMSDAPRRWTVLDVRIRR